MMESRKPPQEIGIESNILGSILLDNECLIDVMSEIQADCFFDPRHKIIFETIEKMYNDNMPIDTVTLYDRLQKDKNIESVGGLSFIAQLGNASSSANVIHHCRIVKEKYILRRVINISSETATMAYDDSLDVFDILDKAQENITSINTDNHNQDNSVSKLVRESLDRCSKMSEMDDLSSVILKTGITDIDEKFKIWKSDQIIIAARPGCGKTTFALNLINGMGQQNIPGVAFSYEMDSIEWSDMLISMNCKIPFENIGLGQVTQDDGAKISRAAHKVHKMPVHIIDSQPYLNEALTILRKYKKKYDIQWALFDYLQLIPTGMKFQNRDLEVAYISKSLMRIKKELGINTFILSQLNRNVESRQSKVPMLSDLRESGSLEQDSAKVFFLYRPAMYGITADENGNSTEKILEVICAKNRKGRTGKTKHLFYGEFALIEDHIDFSNAEANII